MIQSNSWILVSCVATFALLAPRAEAGVKDLINQWEVKAEQSGPMEVKGNSGLANMLISPKDSAAQASDLCQEPSFDAMVRLANGQLLVFKGPFYWELADRKLSEPRQIASDWPGLPAKISAAFTINEVTYFVQGDRVWTFDAERRPVVVDRHKPPVRLFNLFPDFSRRLDNYDAITYWPTTNEIVTLYPDKMLVYGVDTRKTRQLPFSLRAMGSRLASVYLDGDHFLYFFQDGSYSSAEVSGGRRLSTAANWFGCSA